MPVRIVQSKQNGRLKQLRKALSQNGRDGDGTVGIEGPKMVAEAMRAGLRLQTVFAAQEAEGALDDLRLPPDVEVLLVPRELLDSVLATETPQPFAALVESPQWTWEHVLGGHKASAPLIVVLAGLQDPGNLGTILRSAEAFGVDGVISLPGTVSEWNPKAVRASAGSVFRLPLIAVDEAQALTRLRKAGIVLFTTAMVDRALPADKADLCSPTAILIGNEGNGVPADLAARADAVISIPCPGPVESLNAAVAASVILYEASRQRLAAVPRPTDERARTR